MYQQLIGAVAGVIAAISVIPYLYSIVKGETRPARATYAIKSLLGVLLLTSYLGVGARATAWTLLVFAFSPVVILSLSVRKGVGGWSPADRLCLFSALAAIVIWRQSHEAWTALLVAAAVKWIAHAPTLMKLHALPQSESRWSWALALSADALNLCALPHLRASLSLPVINEAVMSGVVVTLMVQQQKTRSRGSG